MLAPQRALCDRDSRATNFWKPMDNQLRLGRLIIVKTPRAPVDSSLRGKAVSISKKFLADHIFDTRSEHVREPQ